MVSEIPTTICTIQYVFNIYQKQLTSETRIIYNYVPVISFKFYLSK